MVKRWVKKGQAKRPTGRTRFVRKGRGTRLTNKISNQERTYNYDIMGEFPVSSYGAATTVYFNTCAIPINFPLYLAQSANWNAGGGGAFSLITGTPAGLIASKYSTLFSFFDEYKVNKLSVIFQPSFSWINTSVNISGDTSEIPNTMYMYHDYDDVALPASESIVLSSGAMPKMMVAGKRCSTTLYQNDKGTDAWINTSLFGLAPSTTTTSSSILPQQTYKSVKLAFKTSTQAATTPYYWGRVYVKYNVTFRGITNA